MTYHKCFLCRRPACESVITTELRTPIGTLWAMYSCRLHMKDLHQKSDELLGVNNGVSRIYSTTTGGFEKSVSAEQCVQDFRAGIEQIESMKQGEPVNA